VRHLKIQLELTLSRLNFLRKLSRGSFGFENLVDIELVIDGRCTELSHSGILWWNSDDTDDLGTVRSINSLLGEYRTWHQLSFVERNCWLTTTTRAFPFPGQGNPLTNVVIKSKMYGRCQFWNSSQKPVQGLYQHFSVVTDYWQEDRDKSHLPGNKVMTVGWPKIETLDIVVHANDDPQMIPFYDRRTTKIMSV
jgi:hypothetical protein